MAKLHQPNPPAESTYRLHPVVSHSDSRGSYRRWAMREAIVLANNHRKANREVRIQLKREYSVPQLKTIRKKICRAMRRACMIAYIIYEFTREVIGFKPGGRPIKILTDMMHGHYMLDTGMGKGELKEFFTNTCLNIGLTNDDFVVRVRRIRKFRRYAFYLTKAKTPYRAILMKKHLGLRKTGVVGDWLIDENGNPTTKKAIWKQYKEKRRRKAIERIQAALCSDREWWLPEDMTNHVKLNEILSRETDEILHDWLCTLSDMPPTFGNQPPRWLYSVQDEIRHDQKRHDLINAIHERIDNNTSIPFDPVGYPVPKLTDHIKLRDVLSREVDEVLHDWLCVIADVPTTFGSTPPSWLYKVHGQKRQDLIDAIQQRIGSNPSIPFDP